MSLHSRSRPSSGHPPKSSSYRTSFLRDVYRLIAGGYHSLAPESLVEKEEPAITGLLVEAIESYLDNPRSPNWTERYAVQEERPIHASTREGKARYRVDIQIESSGRQPRPRFQLEAKRLRETNSKSLASYLGPDGLGCFLSGRYAATHEQAGMLGYVQSGTAATWASRIHEKLNREANRYQLASRSEGLRHQRLVPELEHSYISRHVRPSDGDIDIHHILLLCYVGS